MSPDSNPTTPYGRGASSSQRAPLDCLVIGGGPAGLVSAIYLARFRRRVRLLDAGKSRALRIPVSHNLPGFPEGIRGPDFIARLREQARRHQVEVETARVDKLLRDDDGLFVAHTSDEKIRARTVILATGAVDVEPSLPSLRDAIRQGYVRHCPICDGYEVIDQKVGVVGSGVHLAREALFIRNYTSRLTIFSLHREIAIDSGDRERLQQAGITIVDQPVADLVIENGQVRAVRGADGRQYDFDTVYVAMGATVCSELATHLGATLDVDGNLVVDYRHFETSVPGLYAAGDVVSGLNQIAVAAGQAAVVTTAIHHALGRQLAPARGL